MLTSKAKVDPAVLLSAVLVVLSSWLRRWRTWIAAAQILRWIVGLSRVPFIRSLLLNVSHYVLAEKHRSPSGCRFSAHRRKNPALRLVYAESNVNAFTDKLPPHRLWMWHQLSWNKHPGGEQSNTGRNKVHCGLMTPQPVVHHTRWQGFGLTVGFSVLGAAGGWTGGRKTEGRETEGWTVEWCLLQRGIPRLSEQH